MARLFANSGDPGQTPRAAASDLGLHCLPITLWEVSRLQWVKLVLLGWKLVHNSDAAKITKKSKRKVQGVPQSQTAALPRPQEEEETDKSKQAQTEQTYEKH